MWEHYSHVILTQNVTVSTQRLNRNVINLRECRHPIVPQTMNSNIHSESHPVLHPPPPPTAWSWLFLDFFFSVREMMMYVSSSFFVLMLMCWRAWLDCLGFLEERISQNSLHWCLSSLCVSRSKEVLSDGFHSHQFPVR